MRIRLLEEWHSLIEHFLIGHLSIFSGFSKWNQPCTILHRHQLWPVVHHSLLECGFVVRDFRHFSVTDTFALSGDRREKQNVDLPLYKLPNKSRDILSSLFCEDACKPYRDTASLVLGLHPMTLQLFLPPMAAARPSSPAGLAMCSVLRINFSVT